MHFCDHKKLLGPSGGLLKWYSQPIISMHINESARGKKKLTKKCHTCMGGNILLVERISEKPLQQSSNRLNNFSSPYL